MSRPIFPFIIAAVLCLQSAAVAGNPVHWCARANNGNSISALATDYNQAVILANTFFTANGGMAPNGFHCQHADWSGDKAVLPVDVGVFINSWFVCVMTPGCTEEDYNFDGLVDIVDVALFINDWFRTAGSFCV